MPPSLQSHAGVALAATALPRFYTWQDVIDVVFGGDADACIDAWIHGRIPRAVEQAFLETCPPRWLEVRLLTRIARCLLAGASAHTA